MTTKKSEPVREAKPPKAAEVKKRTEKEPLMYVGPTVNGLGIQNRVYTEIPKAAEAVLEETPELYWSSFLVTLCSEIMLYIETPLVSYSYSLNEVSHSCTS